MSRHRNVRPLAVEEYYRDDYDDEEEEEEEESTEMTPEETAQLESGLEAVKKELAGEIPDLVDSEVKETLWYYYFDIAKSVAYIRKQHAPKPTKKPKQPPPTKKAVPQQFVSNFAGPSPDDVVSNAQGQSKGLDNKKNKKTKDIADAVKELNVVDNAADIERTARTSKHYDVIKEFAAENAKKNSNFVVVGHVDAGKSTLMGRLLYDLKVIDERTIQKFKTESEKIGKSSFQYAWVLDQTEEERARGVTMDIAQNSFETDKAKFTILDAPGHRDFIPNMIAGSSQADFAVLVIDSSTGAFEAGFHLQGQTKEHTLLVRSIGIQRIIVAVNKLDSVGWSEERFEEIRMQMTHFLNSAGFQTKNISFVPCSGLTGENVVKPIKVGKIPWYKGSSLIHELESSSPLARAIDKPLRLTVADVFRGGIQNPVSISGRIESGTIQVGDVLVAQPSGERTAVRAIEVNNEPKPWAVAGHNATVHLAGIDMIHLKQGDVLSPPSSPIPTTQAFTAKILAFATITPMAIDLHRGRLHVPGKIAKLVQTIDKATAEVIKKKPRFIAPGSAATVEVTLDNAIPLESGNKVVFRFGGATVGSGVVV